MMKKIFYTALAITCSLAVCSCTQDKYGNTDNINDYAKNLWDLHGYPKPAPSTEVVPPAPTPPPAPAPTELQKTLQERDLNSTPPPPPPKHKKLDVREAS